MWLSRNLGKKRVAVKKKNKSVKIGGEVKQKWNSKKKKERQEQQISKNEKKIKE